MVIVVVAAYIADLLFGDPEWLPHPVRWMGRLITFLENRLRRREGGLIERVEGVGLVFLVVTTSSWLAYLILSIASRANLYLGLLISIYLAYAALSIKDLKQKAACVLSSINEGDLPRARKELSKIVGRDTQSLDKEGIVRATVESIAENTNDGIVAPLFYLTIGGPVLAIAYKAINTLDSMVGYRSKGYLHFGWASARLDDLANFIPARISGFLICLVGSIGGGGLTRNLRVMNSFGRKHPSPNSGVSEAAMAGALGVRLGGPVAYHGKIFGRSYLGSGDRGLESILIKEAVRISFIVSLIMVACGVCIRWVI